MFGYSPRRSRLVMLLTAPALAVATLAGTTAIADDVISLAGLQEVIISPINYHEDAATAPAVLDTAPLAEGTPLESAITPPPVMEVATPEVQYYAPTCNCCQSTCCTKKKKEDAMAAMKGAYAGVFYANKFDYLNDPCYDGPRFFSDCFKNMKTPFGTLSLGGETRYRYHNERNFRGPNGLTGNDDQFWLSRQRLYADWRVNDCLRIYGELLDASSMGEELAPLPIEENDTDIQNLFVDIKLFDGEYGKLTTRIGRQELLYGAQRTISPLDWANTRRTFEGVRALYQKGDLSLDGFWTRPVNVDPDGADHSDEKQDFFGLYATMKGTSLGTLESYYLGYNSDNVNANNRLTQNFTYHTLGARVTGTTDGGTLYDFEGGYQFGDNNTPDSHSATFITVGLGRKLDTQFWKPTIWGWYDYASGEEDFAEVSVGDGGYHHLFPLAHKYNGFIDLFGRRNLHDLNTQIITPLNKKVTLLVWYHYLMLDEKTTPYNVVMIPYPGTQAEDRELGHEIDILFNINFCPRHNILLGYSHFSGGDYYDSATIGPADEDNDADFFYAQFQTRY